MNIKIEKQKDGSYIAYNTDGGKFGLIGTGNTVSEAKEDFFNSVEEVKVLLKDEGEEIPVSLTESPIFHFDISSLLEYYDVINVSAFSRFLGISDSLMRQYKRGNTYISDAQLARIEDGFHKLGKEMAELKLV